MTSRIYPVAVLAVAVVGLLALPGLSAPGDLVATINVPVASPSCCGIGIAVNCENPATLYYTNSYQPFLYMMDAAGTDLGSVPLFDGATGAPISFGAISWDDGRKKLWGGTDNIGDPPSVYLIDPVTGSCMYMFTLQNAWVGFVDGIALDNDETIWVSDDISVDVEHWTTAGIYLGSITPKNAAGNPLGAISGVAVGKGDLLYLGRNGNGEIVSVTKTGTYISKFATATGRDEDLECDVISFAPLEVLWSKDAYGNYLEVFEVEPGTCQCAGEERYFLDIKPGSCPNPLNVQLRDENDGNGMAVKGNGVLPVAVLGTDDFDVHDIDVSTVLLEGIAPLRHNYSDVGTPFTGEECDCHAMGGDGIVDLSLKFRRADIIMTLGDYYNREMRSLTLTGQLLDGTPFEASDCVRIQTHETGGPMIGAGAPQDVVLNPAVPNPFNPTTVISFELPEAAFTRLAVYDVSGRLVDVLVSEEKGAGTHSIEWNAIRVPSGIYFYRLEVGVFVETRRMVLLK